MNGFDYSFDGTDDYSPIPSSVSTPGIIAQPQAGGGILDSLQGVFARFTSRPTDTTTGVSGQLYQAIYALGAGKIDAARESAARALLASRTGAQFVGTVERERIKQLMPMILLGVAVIFGLAFFMGRR